MKRLLIILALGAGANAICAEENTKANCRSIKDSKKRLTCFDSQEASKSGTNTDVVKNADLALKILRKFATVTSVGVSRQSYGDRLVDSMPDLEDAINGLPSSEMKTAIQESKQAYLDAMELWTRAFQVKYAQVFRVGHEEMMTKYQIMMADGEMDENDRARVVQRPWAYARHALELATNYRATL